MFFCRHVKAEPKGKKTKLIEVGWLLRSDHAHFIWTAPRLLKRSENPPAHAKSATLCPAIMDHNTHIFEVLCPFDLSLRVRMKDDGEAALTDTGGDKSTIAPHTLNQLVSVIPRNQWRVPDRPIVQIKTPYTFIADEVVYVNQTAAYLHYQNPALPGIVVAGRFPTYIWPRPLTWSFEWFDLDRDVILKRGTPWFYVRFEGNDVTRHFRLVEAELTPELRAYMAGTSGVVNYVNRTFSLFATAQERRPGKLLSPLDRSR